MTEQERMEALRNRKVRRLPWHRPPHFDYDAAHLFHLNAACFDHKHIVGKTADRMAAFEHELLELLNAGETAIVVWCILPNHWHALAQTPSLKDTVRAIGKLHGRTSFQWNSKDSQRGRRCWHSCSDRRMRNDAHTYATINYIHNNPIHHGYVKRWQNWPYSSAKNYLQDVGKEEAMRVWKKYPVLDYGAGWDDADM